MKRVTSDQELQRTVDGRKTAVIFHATWCPYCVAFRPVFERELAKQEEYEAVEAVIDDEDNALWEKFAIEVVPTVVFFEGGQPVKRLDGRRGIGLSAGELARALA